MADLFVLTPPVQSEKEVLALPDAAERESALDITQSWIVEAPAGSGKTGLLIQRYLKLLTDASVTAPEQVLAITFTRKAAAEMLDRVFSQLAAAAAGTAPANAFDKETRPLAAAALERDAELGWGLLDQPGRLNIRTVDSVCSDIARSLPILSGSAGRLAATDQPEPLYALAARRTFLQLGGTDGPLHDALHNVLLHRDGSLKNCEQLLADMLRDREQWGDLIPFGRASLTDALLDAEVLPRLELALDQVICAALTQLALAIPQSALDQLTALAAGMAHIEGYKGSVSPIAICAGKFKSPGETAAELEHWRALIHLLLTKQSEWRRRLQARDVSFAISTAEAAELTALIDALRGNEALLEAICAIGTLPPASYPLDQWMVAKDLFRILNRALAELTIVFAERGECDFAELTLASRTALRQVEGGGSADFEAGGPIYFQHLLVDEMQDTSSSQYELIQALTQSWDGHGQTIFLVGDPKQSIYLFRQARVERFLHTMRSGELGDVPLGTLRLTANFRSQPELVADFNADFARIFPSPAAVQAAPMHPEAVPFVAATSIRPKVADVTSRVWHTRVIDSTSPQLARTKRIERVADAREIRGIIEQWRAKPSKKPWKIAVLVRNRSHLEGIVGALGDESLGPAIPFRAVEIEALHERPEVQDVYALTRALLHPADRIAWLAILRAPWCGLSLAELHTLTGADAANLAQHTVRELIAERGELLDAAGCSRLERLWPVLEAGVAAMGRQPLAVTVERVWRSLGGDAYATVAEAANVKAYLQLLDKVEAQPGSFDLAQFEARLKKLYAAPQTDANAIDLVTIHKAKGLEWDVVIVPGLERPSGNDRAPLLAWLELESSTGTAAHVLLAPITGRGEPSKALNSWITSVRRGREAAEMKRLFYVACTRAREELHLFAAPEMSSAGKITRKPGALLAAAWPAAAEHFAAMPAAVEGDQGIHLMPPVLDAEPVETLTLAAAAELVPAQIKRLPLSFDRAAALAGVARLPTGNRVSQPPTHFARPEGSIAARAFGNAVHALLDRLTEQIAGGAAAADLVAGLSSLTPRIIAVLRGEGLPPATVDRLAQRVLHALELTLKDPVGVWLLSPHAGSESEYALTTWLPEEAETRREIRIDRVFRGGASPLVEGTDTLWIVDYKTTVHGAEGLEAFLEQQREQYAPQLEAYAAVLGEKKVRVALYFPMLGRLVDWAFG